MPVYRYEQFESNIAYHRAQSKLTLSQFAQLATNSLPQNTGKNHYPVAKFTLNSYGITSTFLLTEIDPIDNDLAYGLYDFGTGKPTFGYISLSEIEMTTHISKNTFASEKDFYATYPISVYSAAANLTGRITEEKGLLDQLSKLQSPETDTMANPPKILTLKFLR